MMGVDVAVESVAIFVEAIAVKANVAIAVGTNAVIAVAIFVGTNAVMATVAVMDALDAETVTMGMTEDAVLACADDGTNFRCFSIVFPHCLSLPAFAILHIYLRDSSSVSHCLQVLSKYILRFIASASRGVIKDVDREPFPEICFHPLS